ncbi:hypothetical protein ABID22_001539 [Pontibacter aydingkolensis]|uniref:Glycosyltransferase family protein n=1 Tax=Pontibacter aydingkolensis TaxID=1911536 RepID=A0ABS7CTR5_9BACT|nr:glycosyltransferase [Pontibacter aydingkolensis]MBW7467213.1 glycosyltransferase family protein [Pontibacter aydingkolensis]
MISIIICSVNNSNLKRVEANISKTVGCPHEVIAIDNSKNKYSIFTAYNAGAAQAKFDILCFMHEDVFFYSNNWGTALKNIFSSDSDIGLIGACGAIVKTDLPGSWIDTPQEFYVSGLINEVTDTRENSNSDWEEVVVIDGLLMVTTKSIWKDNPFPDRTGYHGYDLYYSLHLGTSKRIVVAKGIKTLHLSKGSFNGEWFCATMEIHEDFRENLPRCTQKNGAIISHAYMISAYKLVFHLHKHVNNFSDRARLMWKYILSNKNVSMLNKSKALYYWIRIRQV